MYAIRYFPSVIFKSLSFKGSRFYLNVVILGSGGDFKLQSHRAWIWNPLWQSENPQTDVGRRAYARRPFFDSMACQLTKIKTPVLTLQRARSALCWPTPLFLKPTPDVVPLPYFSGWAVVHNTLYWKQKLRLHPTACYFFFRWVGFPKLSSSWLIALWESFCLIGLDSGRKKAVQRA